MPCTVLQRVMWAVPPIPVCSSSQAYTPPATTTRLRKHITPATIRKFRFAFAVSGTVFGSCFVCVSARRSSTSGLRFRSPAEGAHTEVDPPAGDRNPDQREDDRNAGVRLGRV